MISVLINGVDRSAVIDWKSLKMKQVLTSQPDSASFSIKYDGVTKTFRPENGDEVIIMDGTDEIFGGKIMRTDENVIARELLEYSVECASWEIDVSRFQVVDVFEDVTAFYILNTIVQENINRNRIALWVGEALTDEAGTSIIDDDHRLIGEHARQYTVATTVAGRFEFTKDFTFFDNLIPVSGDLFLSGWSYVENNVTQIRIRIGNETGGTYTNYLEHTFDVQPGYQYHYLNLNDMTEVGTFDPTDAKVIQFWATGVGKVTFDDWRLLPDDGYTQQNVQDADVIINYAQFNYEEAGQAIARIAERIGANWYIDPSKDIHFSLPEGEIAPFNLTDEAGNYIYSSLNIELDRSTLKNEIIVRGGQEVGSLQVEDLTYQVDGSNNVFQMGYGYKNIEVFLNSVAQTVGIDNVDDFGGYDVLYNFNEKAIKFPSAPAAATPLIVQGNPYIPVIVKKRDTASIANYGVVQYLIVDRSINSREGARQRAQAELMTYRNDLQEGQFKTYESGLHTGQTITIESAIRGIDETFIISRLSLEMLTPEEPVYTATIVSTRSYGMIEFLIDLLRREKLQIVIGGDEVLDLVESYEETITLNEVVTVIAPISASETITLSEDEADYIDDPPIWVAGEYSPTSLTGDRKRPAFADRDNLAQ